MRHLINCIFLLSALIAFAEQPDWCDASKRASNYPRGQYFTGIAYGEVRLNEPVESAIERTKSAARVDALSTISIHVQNQTNSHLHDESFESIDAWTEEIKESFDSRTRTAVDLEIPGLQVEAWSNPNSNEIIAFAYIKKSTLCRQMDKLVTAGLTRIETILDNAEQYIENGQKMQARDVINKVPTLFKEVEQAQRILIAVDPMSDAESLQLDESRQLSHKYILLLAKLKNSINIFLTCNSDFFGDNRNTLADQVKRELSKNGCTFVNESLQADWIISIQVSATLDVTSNNSEYDFVTIEVSGSVFNVTKRSSHDFFESAHEGARKDRGGYKLAVDFVLRKEKLSQAISNDIMEILKSN